jgi:uncharacterized protein (TIGR02266 family)
VDGKSNEAPRIGEGREFPRFEAVFRVRYGTLDELVVGYGNDLSKGGMFLQTDKFLPVNAVVQLQLEMPDDRGEIPVIGRVVHILTEEEAQAQGKAAGMGIQFLDLTAERLVWFESFITRHSEKLAAPARPHRMRVLVVDDVEADRERIAIPFEQRGDQVTRAANGIEALAHCLKTPPDVVIADVEMPRMDGWQLLRILRARPSLAQVPITFVSANAGQRERLQAYQLGVDDFIGKPVHTGELMARVDRLVTRLQMARGGPDRRTLRGDLRQLPVTSVLSFLELERKTGVLFLIGTRTARVFMRDGRPLRLELDDAPAHITSEELIYNVLSWETGQFEFASQDVACPDELKRGISELLLEFARQTDEERRQQP